MAGLEIIDGKRILAVDDEKDVLEVTFHARADYVRRAEHGCRSVPQPHTEKGQNSLGVRCQLLRRVGRPRKCESG